jgi:serine/threonine protein kinase
MPSFANVNSGYGDLDGESAEIYIRPKNINAEVKTSSLWSRRNGNNKERISLRSSVTIDLSLMMPSTPKILLDDQYEIVDKLGIGSAGVVYRAVERKSGQEVALKTLKSADPELANAAKKEYELLSRIGSHPNIIKALEFHNLHGEGTLVLEFFDGSMTLQALVQEQRLQEASVRQPCLALFRAVAHLHGCNILHRDIKPQNVLVSRDLRELRLIDFNVAACLDDGPALTPTGTELYKAPEVLIGEPACPCSDVWASGLCIFFALSSRLPQGRESLDPFSTIKRSDALRPVSFDSNVWQDVSEECKDFLRSCLAVDLECRSTMTDILENDNSWLYLDDPLMRSLNLMSRFVPGSEALLSVFTHTRRMGLDAMR